MKILLNGSRRLSLVVFATGFLFLASPHRSVAQDEMVPIPADANSSLGNTDSEVYFADILVRGRPVFQVGSLADLGARERAKIIN
ncbi:MAG: mechanosensitive ion channel family protein, partial [Coleofasciculus sp. E2-BRE-01]